jgi:hypothetical protein
MAGYQLKSQLGIGHAELGGYAFREGVRQVN